MQVSDDILVLIDLVAHLNVVIAEPLEHLYGEGHPKVLQYAMLVAFI